jgi:hypothetical protein
MPPASHFLAAAGAFASAHPYALAAAALPLLSLLLLLVVPARCSPSRAAYLLYTNPLVGRCLHRLFLATAPSVPHRDGQVFFFGDEEEEEEGAFFAVSFGTQADNLSSALVDCATGSSALIDAADPKRALSHVRLLQRMWDE